MERGEQQKRRSIGKGSHALTALTVSLSVIVSFPLQFRLLDRQNGSSCVIKNPVDLVGRAEWLL
jgi:hypothetical protein